MRSASAGTSPTIIGLAVMYGKPSSLTSSSETEPSRSRALGPHMPTQHCPGETSATLTEPSSGRCVRIQSRSWSPIAPPVTTRKRSSPRRVTVRSHLIPPLGVSIEVYVIDPTGLFIWLVARCCRAASAPGPVTSNLANGVRSNRAARSRVATCSAATVGDHSRASQPARDAPATSSESRRPSFTSCHWGRSHPALSKKTAPSSRCRVKKGVSRMARGLPACCRGWMMSYTSRYCCAARARTYGRPRACG